MNDNTYVIAVGPDDLSHKAKYLVRSIRRLDESIPLYTHVTTSEKGNIPESVVRELSTETTLLEGEAPIPEYPLASKIEAMRLARKETTTEYVTLLDADMLMIRPLTSYRTSDAELLIKPTDTAGRGKNKEVWEKVYAALGQELPSERIVSTVDCQSIYPYWNAGVVVTNNRSFPGHWLEATKTVFQLIDDTDRFVDQIALGAISTMYDTQELDERHNFPLPARRRIPDDVRILHYHYFHQLYRVRNDRIRTILRDIGMSEQIFGRWDPRFVRNVVQGIWNAWASHYKYGPSPALSDGHSED